MALDRDPSSLESNRLITHNKKSYDGLDRQPLVPRIVLTCAVTFCFGFLLALAFLGVGPVAPFSVTATSERPSPPFVSNRIYDTSGRNDTWFSGPCSLSRETALAANCTFDLLSFSWLPDRCRTEDDRRDEEEFLNARTWRYDGEDEQSIENIGSVLEDAQRHRQLTAHESIRFVFTSGEWHRVHCAFMFRRLQRKLVRGEPVDSYMISDHHGQHCRHVLLEAQDMWEWERQGAIVRTRVWVKYPECF